MSSTSAARARHAARWVGWLHVLCAPLTLAALVTSLVGIGLIPITVGLALVVVALPVTRWLGGVHRRLAGAVLGRGVPVPYRPITAERPFARLRQRAADPQSWRDLLWLLVASTVGVTMSLLAVTLFLAIGWYLVFPLLMWLAPTAFETSFGLLYVDTVAESFLGWALAAVALGLWWFAVPPLMRLRARLDLLLLGPTAAARVGLLEQRVQALAETRSEAVDVQAAELRRIERDLHDGAQARLVSSGMTLGMALETWEADPAAARALAEESRSANREALADLRRVVRGIQPPVLSDRGLVGAVGALAVGLPVPTQVVGRLAGRAPAPVESALYFGVAEALTNVSKHAAAQQAVVTIGHVGGELSVVVEDDGRGEARLEPDGGLHGLRRRLAHFDGTLELDSPRGGADPIGHDGAVRVVIGEDLTLLRDGLIRLLEANGATVVAAVDNEADLRRALLETELDVAVVDVRLPPAFTDEGLRAAIEARRRRPGLPIVVLSQYVEPLYAAELLSGGEGAVGYLLKDRVADVGEFVAAVRRVAGGGTVMDPEVISALLASRSRADPLAGLSPRELEALGLMAEGRSNQAIGARMVISEKAVSKHISSIFTKLDLPPDDDDHRRVLAVLAYLRGR